VPTQRSLFQKRHSHSTAAGKGGKNRRRGKNENDEKRELVFKEDGQGASRGAHFLWLLSAAASKSPLLLGTTSAHTARGGACA